MFKKGISGNPTGRPQGAQNKLTQQLRETISDFLFENFKKIKDDFKKLEPKERAKLYCDLLQYALPKLQATSIDFNNESETQIKITRKVIMGLNDRDKK